VRHVATGGFWKLFDEQPERIRDAARKQFALLKLDPYHPSLHFKRVGTLWSARVTGSIRVLAVQEGDAFVWFFIGSHDDAERLITRR
jgi:hypothetical protein